MKLKHIVFALFTVAAAAAPASASMEKSAHDFVLTSIEYTDMPMDQYKGKAVLLVNTASYCGFTPQYEGLQALWEDYRDKGLIVLGVPANDFGDQEPGSEANIKRFCEVNFQVDFPMTKKMMVKGGEGNAPIYDWLASQMGEDSRPKWNFHKYLIDQNGQPVAYFGSRVTPQSDELRGAIDKVLQ